MIVLEGIAFLVLQENAGYVACGKRVMVAVGGKGATMQGFEIMLALVDLFEQPESTHAPIAHFAVLNGIVVANHIYIK